MQQSYEKVSTRWRFFKTLFWRILLGLLPLFMITAIYAFFLMLAFLLYLISLGKSTEFAWKEFDILGILLTIWPIFFALFISKPIKNRLFFLFGKNAWTQIAVYIFSISVALWCFLILDTLGGLDFYVFYKIKMIFTGFTEILFLLLSPFIILGIAFSFQKEIVTKNSDKIEEISQKTKEKIQENTGNEIIIQNNENAILKNPILSFFQKNLHSKEYIFPEKTIFENPQNISFITRAKILMQFIAKKIFVYIIFLLTLLFLYNFAIWPIPHKIWYFELKDPVGTIFYGIIFLLSWIFIINAIFHIFFLHIREIKNTPFRLQLYDIFYKGFYVIITIFLIGGIVLIHEVWSNDNKRLPEIYIYGGNEILGYTILTIIFAEVFLIIYRFYEYFKNKSQT